MPRHFQRPKQPKAPWFIAKFGNNPPPKARKRISPVSVLRRAQDAEYSRLRKKFLALNPYCHVCMDLRETAVPKKSTQVHHKRGRRGGNYLDTNTWIATCDGHHTRIHRVLPEFPDASGPRWAREHGYLRSFH